MRPSGPASLCAFSTGSRIISRAIVPKRRGRTLFLQGEYFWFNVDRNAFTPLPGPKFQGGYAEAAYVLTGETRHYNPGSAAFGGIVPASPLSLTGGGWGAWEIAGRVSTIDRNDQLATANGFVRGRQANYTAALNWYVNRNVRLMFDYLHGDVAKQISGTNAGNAGPKFDAFAMRNQAAFWGICMQICGCCPRAVRGNATARPRIGREIRRRICTCLM